MLHRIQSWLMMDLEISRHGKYTLVSREGGTSPAALVGQMAAPQGEIKKGRGSVKIISLGGRLLACRKYVHGGLLRAFTGEVFFTSKRAEREFETTVYLEENSFPVVSPLGYLVENKGTAKSLYFLSFFEDNQGDLLELLKKGSAKARLRAARDLSRLLAMMGKLGVYHPDMHLQNVLVTSRGLVFLDFDKAYRKKVTKKDMERMFWRLNRFAEKKERAHELIISGKEKMFFLRVFERSWGEKITDDMLKRLEGKRRAYRLGWFLESMLYGNRKP